LDFDDKLLKNEVVEDDKETFVSIFKKTDTSRYKGPDKSGINNRISQKG